MHWVIGAVLGVLGALAVEAVEVQLFVRKNGRQPWRTGKSARPRKGDYPPLRYYVLSVVFRSFAAAVLVGVFTASGQIAGPIGALTLGVGASAWITRAADTKDLGAEPGPAELGTKMTERVVGRRDGTADLAAIERTEKPEEVRDSG